MTYSNIICMKLMKEKHQGRLCNYVCLISWFVSFEFPCSLIPCSTNSYLSCFITCFILSCAILFPASYPELFLIPCTHVFCSNVFLEFTVCTVPFSIQYFHLFLHNLFPTLIDIMLHRYVLPCLTPIIFCPTCTYCPSCIPWFCQFSRWEMSEEEPDGVEEQTRILNCDGLPSNKVTYHDVFTH